MQNNLLPWNEYFAGLEKHMLSASVLIENESGELLVLKANYKTTWSPPGGVIDAGETPRQAACREVREETGVELDIDELEYAAMIVRLGPDAITYLLVFQSKRRLGADGAITLDSSEIDEYVWVSREDVISGKNSRLYNHAVMNWASDEPISYLEVVL